MNSDLQSVEFSRRYDEVIFRPATRALYGSSGFYNVGDWTEGELTLVQACAALVRRHLDAVDALDLGAPCVVLDVGCGLGDGARLMADHWPGALVAGVNISPVQLAHARRHHRGPLWAAMDATRLAVADGSVDVIVCVEAAFHFSPRAGFLSSAMRALRPGGVLVLSDVLFDDPRAVGSWWIPGHDAGLDLEGYGALCREAGFEVALMQDIIGVTWRGFCRHLRAKPRWRAIADSLDPAVRAYLLTALRKPRGSRRLVGRHP